MLIKKIVTANNLDELAKVAGRFAAQCQAELHKRGKDDVPHIMRAEKRSVPGKYLLIVKPSKRKADNLSLGLQLPSKDTH